MSPDKATVFTIPHSTSALSMDIPSSGLYNSSSACIVDDIDSQKSSSGCCPSKTSEFIKQTSASIFQKKTLYKRLPILTWLPKYNRNDFTGDLVAGITVALTVIPQGLAFAGVVGIDLEHGLYSCFMGCLIYIFLGSSKDVPIAPTAISSLLTFHIAEGSWQRTVLFTFLTGLIELGMGIFKLGFLIDFVSGPVSAGFTSAVSLIIFTSQMRDLIVVNTKGSTFVHMWISIVNDIRSIHWNDAYLGIACILILLLMRTLTFVKIGPKEGKKIWQKCLENFLWFIGTSRNASLVCASAGLGYYMREVQAKTPFRLVGNVPSGLPAFQWPPFSITTTTNSTMDVITETHVGFSEMVNSFGLFLIVIPLISILENMTVVQALSEGKSCDATQELLTLGICNIATSFVQGFRSNGGIARAAVLNASGSRTQLHNLYTGLIVIVALLYLTPAFYYIPKATLAAIIIAAVLFTVQYRIIKPIWRTKKTDLIPGLATFVACLIMPLQVGVLVGIGINIIFILYHAARPKLHIETLTTSKSVNYLMLTPDRSLIFPSVEFVRNVVNKHGRRHTLPVVIDCTYIYGADFSAAKIVSTLLGDFAARNQKLYFYNLQPRVAQVFEGLNKSLVVLYDMTALEDKLSQVEKAANL